MRPSKMGLCGPLFLPLRCRPSASALCVKRVTSERSDAPSIRSDEIAPPHVGPPCRGLTTVILIQNAPIMPSFGECFCVLADWARPESSGAPTACLELNNPFELIRPPGARFIFSTALRPNQISFSHDQDP